MLLTDKPRCRQQGPPHTLGREGHALPRSGAMLSFLGLGQIPPQDGHVAAATSCRLS